MSINFRNKSWKIICFSIALILIASCEHQAVKSVTESSSDDTALNTNIVSSDFIDDTEIKKSHTLLSIKIIPDEKVIEQDNKTSSTVVYTVIGKFADGIDEDITDKVTLNIENTEVGIFDDNTLTTSSFDDATAISSIISAKYKEFTAKTQVTVASYAMSGLSKDFFFILRYNEKGEHEVKPFEFSTDIPKLDVFFDMDTTGSMDGFITNLKNSLTSNIMPSITETIWDTWTGVGAYNDFPYGNYGLPPDQPFWLKQKMTSLISESQDAVNILSADGGEDLPESMIESLYQIATGEGLSSPATTNVPANHEGTGGVVFRNDSMRVIIPLTDIYSHTIDENSITDYTNGEVIAVAHSRIQTLNALSKICTKVVGVSNNEGIQNMIDFAIDTNAFVPPMAWGEIDKRPDGCGEHECCTGKNGAGVASQTIDGVSELCPLAFLVDDQGTGLGLAIVSGLNMLTKFSKFNVVTQITGYLEGSNSEILPKNKTTKDFIKEIKTLNYIKPSEPEWLENPIMKSASFENVTPGTSLRFNIEAYNDFVKPTSQPQIFYADVTILAGGCTPLDNRKIIILVPPEKIMRID